MSVIPYIEGAAVNCGARTLPPKIIPSPTLSQKINYKSGGADREYQEDF